MSLDRTPIKALEDTLDLATSERINTAVDRIVRAKEAGKNVVVVTGSDPNVHEGVTSLIAELMRLGVVDGVSTSSAVVAHEMGGTLDKVKRCDGVALGLSPSILPLGGDFELTLLEAEVEKEIHENLSLNLDLIEKLKKAPGKTIIKAAGNLGYPMGLWLERLSWEIGALARMHSMSFEEVAGLGADERTMIGIGAKMKRPVLVTIPQLIGGGATGLAIGDSLSITERASRLAHLLESADVIVESAVALTQEVHDGPFECHTGHGLWAAWEGHYHYSLKNKTLVRIDLDPALDAVHQAERGGAAVQQAIADGLPKTKTFKVPFRMEMSGFARHEGSMPIIGDIGVVWPVLAQRLSERLKLDLQFISYPQQTDEGKEMRERIVREVRAISRRKMLNALNATGGAS